MESLNEALDRLGINRQSEDPNHSVQRPQADQPGLVQNPQPQRDRQPGDPAELNKRLFGW